MSQLTTPPDPNAPWYKRALRHLFDWSEFSGWMPATLFLGLFAWAFMGGLQRHAGDDVIAVFIMLAPKILYALAAAGLTSLIVRRWRFRLDKEQQQKLWEATVAGKRGAIVLFVGNLVFTLCVLYLTFSFFALPSSYSPPH